ncbi:uncharacterized protein N7500_005232 [Penicillium coprophilum]|uniref:uncharacterized protein n=1 Tax=Penicillium coprophilum TaxID=36646 RepID=UPI00238914A8|nr:uncharacterized protein N7500_005232 [Penicillium coprophilum]KAJ5163402.1 hypothetical protein N7500_005232 [Penicillium coprophilum]
MMSRSQSSLGYMDSGREDSAPGASPSLNQQSTSGPINLSGLVCNVRRTTGKEPRPLVGATTTILGDKLYVFGGRILSRSRPQLTSDLYELDLIRRHWTRIEPAGDVPPPRYFHSVCALGDNKLVCYGGMSPAPSTPKDPENPAEPQPQSQSEVVVMSDIHIFDVPSRAWTRVAAHESPQGRYAHCATILPSSACFTSASAPLSAIHNNPESSTHQGTLGVDIDGFGGAEMVVVGGQDSSNHYIEQISVFNLRSLKWTNTSPLGRSCGAYRSVVAPLVGMDVSEIGSSAPDRDQHEPIQDSTESPGCPMLIYSNYNFLDVKLELQVRLPDGRLVERPMQSQASPRDCVSQTQEYALWALDLKTLTWGRIDAGGSVFGQGSWNRGVLWPRRNSFVILGHRKRSLVDDYNHRRINFSHVCLVELEAFGLYNNPCRTAPTSGYKSYSSSSVPASLQKKQARAIFARNGRHGVAGCGGERISVNSRVLTRRWGPYFIQLLRESSDGGVADIGTLRPANIHPSRNSSITITPSIGSDATTLVNQAVPSKSLLENLEVPSAHSLAPTSRPRVLYLPHTILTLQVLVQYLYTSALPATGTSLCTPQILCSLLQLARPYQIDGLLEATVERLHQVLDGRNAAAVFNAAAMAAGGGRGTGFNGGPGGTLEALNGAYTGHNGTALAIGENSNSQHGALASDSSDTEHGGASASAASSTGDLTNFARGIPSLRIDTSVSQHSRQRSANRDREDSISNPSTATSASSASFSQSDSEWVSGDESRSQSRSQSRSTHHRRDTDAELRRPQRELWTGDLSSVIGLQKRGLRGLMEGRRMRERSSKPTSTGSGSISMPPSAGSGEQNAPFQGVAS